MSRVGATRLIGAGRRRRRVCHAEAGKRPVRRKTSVHGCPCGGVPCRRCELALPVRTAACDPDRAGWRGACHRHV
ncbi:hypothetical protein A8E94_16730 [Burkholderia cenocepacia]|nr:hypothetical protein A8E94_16730 [Burkholderia cenocepacia]ONW19542.1 hypothetical protein A8E90_12330 [Burkholderia cenocepacia]ONW47363.1 hypothetical protein A8E92_19815 [Burkholderia cenocepacia]